MSTQRELALIEYLNGVSLKQIVEYYGERKKTVQKWFFEDNWEFEKREHERHVRQTTFMRFSKSVSESVERFLEVARLMSQMSFEVFADLYKTKQYKTAKGRATVKEWANIAKTGSMIFNNVSPVFSDDLAEMMITEIKKSKKKKFSKV